MNTNPTQSGTPADARRATGAHTPAATRYDQLAVNAIADLVHRGGAPAVAGLDNDAIADLAVRALFQDLNNPPSSAEVDTLAGRCGRIRRCSRRGIFGR